MSSNKKIQKTVSLTPEIFDKVKAYADKLGIPYKPLLCQISQELKKLFFEFFYYYS